MENSTILLLVIGLLILVILNMNIHNIVPMLGFIEQTLIILMLARMFCFVGSLAIKYVSMNN